MILILYNKAHVNYVLITSVYFYYYVILYFAAENFKVAILVSSGCYKKTTIDWVV